MYAGIERSRGEQIGQMNIRPADKPVKNGVKIKEIEVEVREEENIFQLPSYGVIDSIDNFGIPPFNEWAIGVDSIRDMDITVELDGDERHRERFCSQLKTPNRASLELEREREKLQEKYSTEEIILPSGETSVAVSDSNHSNGNCHTAIEREVAGNRTELKDLERLRLTDEEKEYFRGIKREERFPDTAVLKRVSVSGARPAVIEELYPFWDRKQFDGENLRILEMGYLDYGDNETKLDERHGRWYKLISFPSFRYSTMEIREGNWKSKRVEQGDEEFHIIENYDKHLYSLE